MSCWVEPFALASASCYGRAEDVLVEPVVVPELKFRHVKGKIFLADFMKRPDHTALEDRPKAFDGVGMDRSNHILPLRVIDDLVRILLLELAVSHPLIGDQQADVIGYGFIRKACQRFGFHVRNNSGHHIALPLNGADNNRLARSGSARAAVSIISMSVLGFASDKGFIDFDDTHELSEATILQSNSDPVTHVPSCAVGAHADGPIDLQSAHALFAGQHHVNDAKPRPKRIVRVLENGSDKQREAIASGATVCALPMIGTARQRVCLDVAAAGARHAYRPTLFDQEVFAGVFRWKQLFKVVYRHLLDAWCLRHGVLQFTVDRRIA